MSSATATPPPAAAEAKEATPPDKTLGDKLLTATPIFLTVLATVLAGLSSSEQTMAHYYRALASQQQSKATDQWGYFQAKRIRGTNVELTADLLHPSGPFEP